jgi:hypothetical protein
LDVLVMLLYTKRSCFLFSCCFVSCRCVWLLLACWFSTRGPSKRYELIINTTIAEELQGEKLSSLKTKLSVFLLVTLTVLSAVIFSQQIAIQIVRGEQTEAKNVIIIGWDGVQRNHLYELLNRNLLPNLASFINLGTIVNITVTDHGTDTKAGWTQILTGYRWWQTGVYNNVYWFHSIPAGYTIPERVENYFGRNQIITGFIVGKSFHMEITDGTFDTASGTYTHQALYRNLPATLDVVSNGDRNSSVIGQLALNFIENRKNNHFFTFFHFSDPDTAGHFQGGENSDAYEQAIERCDYEFGRILEKLNSANLTQKTLIYLTADHGFDEGGKAHNNAPYIFLASNDKNVARNGDQIDVAPTIYYGLGMWGQSFAPQLEGFPLQVSLPSEVEEARQKVLADLKKPPVATILSPANGAALDGKVNIVFNASDSYLSSVLLLIDNTLVADGPWTWQTKDPVEANGSYTWDTKNVAAGAHTITLLSFDEHGSNNAPSINTVTVNIASPNPTPSAMPTSVPTQTRSPTSTPKPTTQPTTTPTPTPSQPTEPTLTESPKPSSTAMTEPFTISREATYPIVVIVAVVIIVLVTLLFRKLQTK